MLLGWDANGKYWKLLLYEYSRVRLAQCPLAIIIAADLGSPENDVVFSS